VEMITSVPLSVQRDWDLLTKRPRNVMYTEAVERKRRMLWGILLLVLALITSVFQLRTFPRVNVEFLPSVFVFIGIWAIAAAAIIAGLEGSLREQYTLLRDGVPYVGTIIRRSMTNPFMARDDGDVTTSTQIPHADYELSTLYQVVYCIILPDETISTGAVSVSKTLYDQWELDTPLIVLVDPNNPTRYNLYDLLSDVALRP
jgi:hypothetical protein